MYYFVNERRSFYINRLQIKIQESPYINPPHPCILIDGLELDIWLDRLYPDQNYLGLIPFIYDWISTEAEQQLVLQRYLKKQEIVILPILMCPDDCNLWCTVVVAEVIIQENEIWWNRIGIDTSDILSSYHNLGHSVEWLEHIPLLKFEKQSYYNELDRIYLATST